VGAQSLAVPTLPGPHVEVGVEGGLSVGRSRICQSGSRSASSFTVRVPG
jgi:hypothetical protein